jgi:hypothetical protein
MKVILDFDKEEVNNTLQQLRCFKDDYLRWVVEDDSPAEDPEDILWYLKTFHKLDSLILKIIHKMDEEPPENMQKNVNEVCK